MENEPSTASPAGGHWWLLPLLLGFVLAAIIWSRVHGIREAPAVVNKDRPAPVADIGPRETVALDIDFGGGQKKNFDPIAWHEGMTVAALLNATPGLAVSLKGSGESAFLTTIDGVANQGAAADNWTYAVNGKTADRSFQIYHLQPGDRVLWTFGPQQ